MKHNINWNEAWAILLTGSAALFAALILAILSVMSTHYLFHRVAHGARCEHVFPIDTEAQRRSVQNHLERMEQIRQSGSGTQ